MKTAGVIIVIGTVLTVTCIVIGIRAAARAYDERRASSRFDR